MSPIAATNQIDPPQAGVLSGRFRRAARLREDDAGHRAVAQAVVRAKQGDQDAIRFLYLRYADNVYGYVASIVRDEHEAEDVTQQVFAKLMTSHRQVRAARRPVLRLDPARWPQRRHRPHAQRRAVPASEVLAPTSASTDEGTTRGIARATCATRSPTLPEEQRDVIVLRHVVGLTPRRRSPAAWASTEPSIHGLHHRGRVRPADRAARTRWAAPRRSPRGGGVTPAERSPDTRGDPGHATGPGRPDRCSKSCWRSCERVAAAGAFTMGAELEAFESEFAAYCGTAAARRRVIRAPRRSSLALRALGIGVGDEVIVPANSFIATAEAVQLGGRHAEARRRRPADAPDHRRSTSRRPSRRAPRCVIPVHLMGSTVDWTRSWRSHAAPGLRVIEDTAQAHGAMLPGPAGRAAIGDIGCFSFYPTKNLGAWGDGGAIVTDDEALADRAAAAALARRVPALPPPDRRHDGTARRPAGRDPARQAPAPGRSQRRPSPCRRGAARRAGGHVGRAAGRAPSTDGDHVYHLFIVRTDERDALRGHLERPRGVATRCTTRSRSTAPRRTRTSAGGRQRCPVSERLAQEICTLPLFPTHVRRRRRAHRGRGAVLRPRSSRRIMTTRSPLTARSGSPSSDTATGARTSSATSSSARSSSSRASASATPTAAAAFTVSACPACPVIDDLDDVLADPTRRRGHRRDAAAHPPRDRQRRRCGPASTCSSRSRWRRPASDALDLVELADATRPGADAGPHVPLQPAGEQGPRPDRPDVLGEIYFVTSSRMNLGKYQSDGVICDLAPHDLSILLYWLERADRAGRGVGPQRLPGRASPRRRS